MSWCIANVPKGWLGNNPPMRSLVVVAGIIACATGLLACEHTETPAPASPQEPLPNSIAGQLARPWRHVTSPVSDQRFAQDKAKCAKMAHTARIDAGTPEIKFLSVFIDCMKVQGYEPDDSPQASPKRRIDDVR